MSSTFVFSTLGRDTETDKYSHTVRMSTLSIVNGMNIQSQSGKSIGSGGDGPNGRKHVPC